SSLDGPDAVELVDVPEPDDDRLVTIAVKAAGVAFPELLQTRGLYQLKPDLPFVPGAEVAGVVESAPEGSGFTAGDRVAALSLLGGFAEKVQARPDLTFALPDDVGFEEAASFTFNYATVYFALMERGGLAEGEAVLVHGASGGIGTAAIQMAKAFGAGRVIGVVSTEAKGQVATAALAARARPTARHRVHRRRDPRGQGQPSAAEQRLGRRGRVGRLRDVPPGSCGSGVGGDAPAPAQRRPASCRRWRPLARRRHDR